MMILKIAVQEATSMLETKCVGDNNKLLVTVLIILITNIHCLFKLASGSNIQKTSPTSNENTVALKVYYFN